jgi:hypothetical protein
MLASKLPSHVHAINCDVAEVLTEGSNDGLKGSTIFNVASFNHRLLSSVRILRAPETVQVGEVLTDVLAPPTFTTENRKADVSPEALSNRWCISLQQAKLTLKHSTQIYRRSALLPLSRRYKADRIYDRNRLGGEWFTDTVFGPGKSRMGNKCGQLFANDSHFETFFPKDTESKSGEALRTFCKTFGVPSHLRFDGAKTMNDPGTMFQKIVRSEGITCHTSEAHMHNQSPAEGVVREVKRRWWRIMFKTRCPKVFWDFGFKWCANIMSITFLRNHRIDKGVPLQKLTGETVDISQYLKFGFYDRVWYRENTGLGQIHLGRWLGVVENRGSLFTYHILRANGEVTGHSTV